MMLLPRHAADATMPRPPMLAAAAGNIDDYCFAMILPPHCAIRCLRFLWRCHFSWRVRHCGALLSWRMPLRFHMRHEPLLPLAAC